MAKFQFWGHSLHFWHSYLSYDPRADLSAARYPVIYLDGTEDALDLGKSRAAAESLRAAGVDIEMLEYPGVGHKMLSVKSQLRDDLIAWAKRKHL
ncbi:MAG: hypothetical protein ABTD50_12860 [Polyangiaceae bacterium]|jgi:predicted esterase